MRIEPYDAFAYAYDKGLGERFFRAARRILEQLLTRYPTSHKTHLDVACGTGLALEFFRTRGWKTLGVDASLPMLSLARARGTVVAGDFRALPLRRTFARITCLYDSLNHLKDQSDLVAAFRAVSRLMDPDSLFFFDMNHPDIYPEIWGMKKPFIAEGPQFRLEMATAFRKRDATGLALVTGWAVLPTGGRVEIHERHEQRAYSEREIVDALESAGLLPVEVIDFDPYNEAETLDGGGVKLFFVCARR